MSAYFSPDGATGFITLFGTQLGLSPSPATHTRWARALGQNLQYSALSISNEREFLELATALMRSPQFQGANITNPFKTSALSLSGVELDSSALLCGAANTLFRNRSTPASHWTLANTDLVGCSESLKKILSQNPTRAARTDVVILGSGAMARTYLAALYASSLPVRSNVKIFIVSRSQNSFVPATAHWPNSPQPRFTNFQTAPWRSAVDPDEMGASDLICINTLPSGTSADCETLTFEAVNAIEKSGQWQTKALLCSTYGSRTWHRQAQDFGWSVMNGNLLFEIQARASFRAWTGCDAPNLATALQPF